MANRTENRVENVVVSANMDPSVESVPKDASVRDRVMSIATSQLMPSAAEVSARTSLRLPGGCYLGEVQNGEPHGEGRMEFYLGYEKQAYQGQWKEGRPDGTGTMWYANGNIYKGDWKNGLFHGQGTFTGRESNCKYTGEWQCGAQHGKGRWEVHVEGKRFRSCACHYGQGCLVKKGPCKITYEGSLTSNQPQGKGILEVVDFSRNRTEKYAGEFLQGLYHGNGKESMKYDIGECSYQGMWRLGEHSGQGEYSESWDTKGENLSGIFEEDPINHVTDRLWQGVREEYNCPIGGEARTSKIYEIRDGVKRSCQTKSTSCPCCIQ